MSLSKHSTFAGINPVLKNLFVTVSRKEEVVDFQEQHVYVGPDDVAVSAAYRRRAAFKAAYSEHCDTKRFKGWNGVVQDVYLDKKMAQLGGDTEEIIAKRTLAIMDAEMSLAVEKGEDPLKKFGNHQIMQALLVAESVEGESVTRKYVRKTWSRGRLMEIKHYYDALCDLSVSGHDLWHRQKSPGTREDHKYLLLTHPDIPNILAPDKAGARLEIARYIYRMCEQNSDPADREDPVERLPGGNIPRDDSTDGPVWGPMQIDNPNLDQPRKSKIKRKNKAMQIGTSIGRIDRLSVDQKIFNRKMRVQGFIGTVLIDVSGSMEWKLDDLQFAIENSPGATIATYSGKYTKGNLTIVGKGGRMARQQAIYDAQWGNNLVDKPALEWLAKQKGPRIWVSDGGVHPLKQGSTLSAQQDCAEVVCQNQIHQILSFKDLQVYLSEKGFL